MANYEVKKSSSASAMCLSGSISCDYAGGVEESITHRIVNKKLKLDL